MTDEWRIISRIGGGAVQLVDITHNCKGDAPKDVSIDGDCITCTACGSVAPDSIVQAYRRTLGNVGVEQ